MLPSSESLSLHTEVEITIYTTEGHWHEVHTVESEQRDVTNLYYCLTCVLTHQSNLWRIRNGMAP